MKRLYLAMAAWLIFMHGAMAQLIVTANENDQSLSLVDTAKQGPDAVTTVDIGFMPHNVQNTGNLVLATGMKHGEQSGGVLAIYQVENQRLKLLKTIDVGHHAAHVITDAKGETAYVTLSEDDAVAVVDIKNGNIVKKIKVGAFPHGLRMSPDEQKIYVANLKGNSVTIIDAASWEKASDIEINGNPVQTGFSPDGAMAFVSLNDRDSVAIIDTIQQKTIATVVTGPKPVQVYANKQYVFIANQGDAKNPGESVSVVDWHEQHKVKDISVGGGPHGVALTSDGKYIAITSLYSGRLTWIDAETLMPISSWNVGATPNGVTIIE